MITCTEEVSSTRLESIIRLCYETNDLTARYASINLSMICVNQSKEKQLQNHN
jgi:hypothetical protein